MLIHERINPLPYFIEQAEKDIDRVLNRCSRLEDEGSSEVPGMTYEQGVKAAIEWLTTKGASNPLE